VKSLSSSQIFELFKKRDSQFWSKRARDRSLFLFHEAAERVPAYKDFLKKNKIKAERIITHEDFQRVPSITKQNYLRQYSLKDLAWDGHLKKSLVFTSTSGSTGEPFYFPRSEALEWQSSIYHEMFLEIDPANRKKSTLVVVSFGMGVWIGGTITFRAFQQIAEKRGYPISILTPGINKKEILEGLRRLAPKFDQVILCGYPPFVKDIIEEGDDYGINWKKLNLKLIFAAEAFSEDFRSYLIKKTGIKNLYTDTMNIYGSADMGTMAEETPISILIRRLSCQSKELHSKLFSLTSRLPTLVQFNPLFINFETLKGKILCTGDSAVPLIRYDIGDQGDVLTFDQVADIFKKSDRDLNEEIRYHKLGRTVSRLPFVYIYERADLSTKLYGAIVFPEHVREALQDSRLTRFLTGKFTMVTKFDSHHNQFLEVNIELKPKTKPSKVLKYLTQNIILKNLLKRSAEYKNNYNVIPDKVIPRIIFWPYEDTLYFKPGIKQNWVKK